MSDRTGAVGTTHGGEATEGERADGIEVSAAEGRGRRYRWSLWLLVAAVAALVVVALSFPVAIGIRGDLLRARSAMERGRAELLAGDATAAATSFEEGRALFAAAEGRARGVVFLPLRSLPIVGRTLDAVVAISASGATTAEAAALLADAAAELPGGLESLAPTSGRFPLERITLLAEAAEEADALVTHAVEDLSAAPDSMLIGPVAAARRDAADQLEDLKGTIHTGAALLAGLPEFLGSDGARTYFFGAANPAELRGTGGLIGAYSLLTVRDGRLRFSTFAPIHAIPHAPLDEVPPPNEDFATNYEQFREEGRFWTSINVMPDFPSVAEAILSGYESGTGERLDGVIVVDPFALAALLETTGPVNLRGYGVEIDADNVVPFTTNEAYSLFSDSARRKRVLGDVARVAFERFMAHPVEMQDLRRLVEAAADRHIQVYSTDPAMQDVLRGTATGGTLIPPMSDGDFVSIVISSGAGSKVDFYQRRRIAYSVVLHDDGTATATTELLLHNRAPTSGQPTYVLGSSPLVDEPGESIELVHVYCGRDCVPRQASLDGDPVDVFTRSDLGARYVQHYYSIRAGEEVAFQVGWDDPDAWTGNSSGGSFRTTFVNQTTVEPAVVQIRIQPPPGMAIVEADEPLRIVDGVAVYDGPPDTITELEIRFAPSLPVRLWRNVTRFLTTPVIEL
jgi:hypothetical protein